MPLVFAWNANMQKMDSLTTELDLCGRFAITVDQVLSSTECQELIDLAEESGTFRSATINEAGQKVDCKEVRNCLRWINDDPTLADTLFQKVRKHLPAKWGRRQLSRLNSHLKFIKYQEGHYFKPHYDGEYATPDGAETSYITVQFYLNEGFTGGDDLHASHWPWKQATRSRCTQNRAGLDI